MPSTEPLLADNAPWKQRFRAPTVTWTEIAKGDPRRGLACSNRAGVVQLYAWDVPSGTLRQVTSQPEGVFSGSISPDGHFIYYLDDEQGNEIGHYVRIPYQGGEAVDVTPDLPPYSPVGFGFSPSGTHLGFMGATPEGFHAYVVALDPDGGIGTPQLIYRGKAIAFGPILSFAGEIAVVASAERGDKLQFSLKAFDVESSAAIADLWDGQETSIEPLAFSPVPGDFRLLAKSDRSGISRPLVWNPQTGERTDLQVGSLEGEIVPLDWSPDGERVLLCQINRAVQHLFVYNLTDDTYISLDHPSGTFDYFGSGFSFVSDSEIWAQWENSTHPTQLIALDARTGAHIRTLLGAGEVPPGRSWRSVSFPSIDGKEIQAWLATPEGEGPFPTILHTHGGPELVATEMFLPPAQAWLDHGFAFFSVNYRGSTTFGRAFKEQIWRNPGYWEVEDMAAGYHWLVDQQIARPDAVFLNGRSYGGYLTLQGLGTKPELWAGGMAVVALADWVSQYEDESDTMRGVDVPFMGGTPEEQPEIYARASPITYVEQVRAPVVIIQGRNDTRCPARQVALYEAKMRELGKPIEVHWFDAGHFIGPVEQAIDHHEIFLRFAYRVLNTL